MKIVKRVLIFVIVFFLVILTAFTVSPYPLAMVTHALFDGGVATVPDNYETILKNVTVKQDFQYDSEFKNNYYDVIVPKDFNAEMPTIFWVHGGAYVGGDKDDVTEYAVQIANEGYAVVNINYQLAPYANYPAPLKQIGDVYKSILTNNDNNLNLDKIYFAGDSAGAQMVAQFVNAQVDDSYSETINIQPIVERKSIAGILLFCGPYDFKELKESSDSRIYQYIVGQIGWSYFGTKKWMDSHKIDEVSIVNFISKNFPAAFISDGNTNSFESHARQLGNILSDLEIYNQQVYYDQSEVVLEHEYQFKMDTAHAQRTFEHMIEFLETTQLER